MWLFMGAQCRRNPVHDKPHKRVQPDDRAKLLSWMRRDGVKRDEDRDRDWVGNVDDALVRERAVGGR